MIQLWKEISVRTKIIPMITTVCKNKHIYLFFFFLILVPATLCKNTNDEYSSSADYNTEECFLKPTSPKLNVE